MQGTAFLRKGNLYSVFRTEVLSANLFELGYESGFSYRSFKKIHSGK